MKKMLFSLFTAATLSAAPQAVVFDWGNVLAFHSREKIVEYLCAQFQITPEDFEQVNGEKRLAMKKGQSEIDFWIAYAEQKQIELPQNWASLYSTVIKESIGADPKMFALIDDLKGKEVRVGLLSNIEERYALLIQKYGFYEPFDPCLLSAEIGVDKPDPKAYQILIEQMELPPEEIVFIDDKEENIEAAQKLGIDGILFESPEQIRKELANRRLL